MSYRDGLVNEISKLSRDLDKKRSEVSEMELKLEVAYEKLRVNDNSIVTMLKFYELNKREIGDFNEK